MAGNNRALGKGDLVRHHARQHLGVDVLVDEHFLCQRARARGMGPVVPQQVADLQLAGDPGYPLALACGHSALKTDLTPGASGIGCGGTRAATLRSESAAKWREQMADMEFTGKIDAIRLEIAALLDGKKAHGKQRAALEEILQLLSEAADAAEEAGL